MSKKAKTETSGTTVKPTTDGWFVLHASEAPWYRNEQFGRVCIFEGDARFKDIGVNIHVVEPGQPACLYHRESAQEDFFVLSGECVVLVDEEEVPLKAGHFVHCPPGVDHVFKGAGNGPCSILMLGHRFDNREITYPVSEFAAEREVSADAETNDPKVAYAKYPRWEPLDEHPWPLD
jgi:uncharacterized cupin superfamily protein